MRCTSEHTYTQAHKTISNIYKPFCDVWKIFITAVIFVKTGLLHFVHLLSSVIFKFSNRYMKVPSCSYYLAETFPY